MAKKKKSKKKAARKKKTTKRKKVVKAAKRRKVKGAPENKMVRRRFETKQDEVVQEFLDEDEEQLGFQIDDTRSHADDEIDNFIDRDEGDFEDVDYGNGEFGYNDY